MTCQLIGESSLLIECAEVLLRADQRICGIISSEPAIRRWANERGIASISADGNYAEFLVREPFDVLFSIVNFQILDASILRLPRLYAINFHDALLPSYAGLNATAWALINREARHGVSWHLMQARADAGEVLRSREVDIAADETTRSLNLKCFDAGLSSFRDLLGDLMAGQERPTTQAAGARTYYAKYARPDCLISWRMPAEHIDALVRACDHGPRDNQFALAKVLLGEIPAAVGRVRVSGLSTQAPGTIRSLSAQGIRVATATHDVVLEQLSNLDGSPISFQQLLDNEALKVGAVLRSWDPKCDGEFTHELDSAVRNENHWIEELKATSVLQSPLPPAESAIHRRRADETGSCVRGALKCDAGNSWEDTVAGMLAFLARLSGEHQFHIGFARERKDWASWQRAVLSEVLPFRSPAAHPGRSFADFRSEVIETLSTLRARGRYLSDAQARYSALRSQEMPLAERFPVIVHESGATLDSDIGPGRAELVIHVDMLSGEPTFQFDHQRYCAEQAREILSGFHSFMQSALRSPQIPIGDLPLVTSEQQQRLLAEADRTVVRRSWTDVPRLFAERALQTPVAIAIGCATEHVTYAQLKHRVDVLATHLQARGIGRGSRVALCVERSIDMVVAMLAVLKAGACYVPIDPEYPQERVAFMLEDSQPAVLIKHTRLTVDVASIPILELDSEWSRLEAAFVANGVKPACEIRADDVAYVIYTSGSTGRPKGVQVLHRGLTNLLQSVSCRPGVTCSDHLLALSTFSFDIAAAELFLPLINGAKLTVATAEAVRDPFLLQAQLLADPPTILQATPATWRMLLSAGWAGDGSMRIFSTGEALPPDLAETLLSRGREVWNLYGPTETTIFSSVARVHANERINIGRPVDNTRMYVLDANRSVVPLGVVGELYIAGEGVGLGYLNRDDLTERAFLPDPFAGTGRMYRTGDAVRYWSDFRIEYLNRIDNQVKIRGYRIELGEIEATLIRHPSVVEAAVTVHEGSNAVRQLMAYVRMGKDTPTDERELREYLRRSLPSYMLPARIIFIGVFPLTPSGKINRRALSPPPEEMRSSTSLNTQGTEQFVLGVWCQFLRKASLDVHDNFFDAGGDSILLVQILSRLRERYGAELSSVNLFEYPTVASIAAFIDTRNSTTAPRAAAVDASTKRSIQSRRLKERLNLRGGPI